MKANHNRKLPGNPSQMGVSNNAKLLKWKQITTIYWKNYIERMVFPTMQSY